MDAKTFFDNFGLIASAPNGIEQLRSMILQLAVQGKFSANTSTWTKERLGNSISLISGQHLTGDQQNDKELGLPYVTGASDFGSIYPVITRWTQHPKAQAKKGDVLISVKGTVGQINLVNTENLALGRQVMAARPLNFTSEYLLILLRSFESHFLDKSVGISVPGISRNEILSLDIERPSRKEQSRIVAAVERLLAICDRLELLNKKTRALRYRNTTFFDGLVTARTQAARGESWQRIANNLPLILNTSDFQIIKDMFDRLGLQGKLTTSEFEVKNSDLDQIKNKTHNIKDLYIVKKWIRKQKTISSELLVDYNLSQSWPIAALDDIAVVMGGVTKGRNLSNKETSTFPYLRVANVQRGTLDLRDIQKIEIATEEYAKFSLKNNDLLVAEGGDWDKVGRAALWNNQILDCVHQNHVFKVRMVSNLLLPEWLEFIFNSPYGKSYFSTAAKKTTNLASINMTQLRSFPCPIPSKPEQKAILDLINNVKSLLERHSLLQENKSKKSICLVNELIKSITGIEIFRRESMKAPKTEIITELSIKHAPSDSTAAPLYALLQQEGGKLTAKALWQTSTFDDINQFYQQLRTEIHNGWIEQGELTVHVEKTEDNA